MNKLVTQVRSLPTTSGLEADWDYSGRKERDGQRKKIAKATEKKKKLKKSKRRGSEGKRGCPSPTRGGFCGRRQMNRESMNPSVGYAPVFGLVKDHYSTCCMSRIGAWTPMLLAKA